MIEERTVLRLPQTAHIIGHLWQRLAYSVTAMVATIKLSK